VSEREDQEIRRLLRAAVPPVREREPSSDLWPRLVRRLDERPSPWIWLDCALAGAVVAVFIFYPQVVPWVLMQC